MEKQQLPIGSVVSVQGVDENVLVMSQFPKIKIKGIEGYFDFGGTILPLGFSGENLVLFNKEDITDLLFIGYIDKSFQEFLKAANTPSNFEGAVRFTRGDL